MDFYPYFFTSGNFDNEFFSVIISDDKGGKQDGYLCRINLLYEWYLIYHDL